MARESKPPRPDDPAQSQCLLEVAQEHGADMNGPQFEAAPRKVARQAAAPEARREGTEA